MGRENLHLRAAIIRLFFFRNIQKRPLTCRDRSAMVYVQAFRLTIFIHPPLKGQAPEVVCGALGNSVSVEHWEQNHIGFFTCY